jgi:hypothetical protein
LLGFPHSFGRDGISASRARSATAQTLRVGSLVAGRYADNDVKSAEMVHARNE